MLKEERKKQNKYTHISRQKTLMVLMFSIIMTDTYFKALSIMKDFMEMKTNYIDMVEEFKSTRSSWEIKLIVVVLLNYGGSNKKVEMEMLIHSSYEKLIVLETDWDVFDDIIKPSV